MLRANPAPAFGHDGHMPDASKPASCGESLIGTFVSPPSPTGHSPPTGDPITALRGGVPLGSGGPSSSRVGCGLGPEATGCLPQPHGVEVAPEKRAGDHPTEESA